MKPILNSKFYCLGLFCAILFCSFTYAQVGINITPTTIPAIDVTKTLDVNGDARLRGDTRLDGALLPGNAAGGVDQMLLSQGTGTPPVWGPGFINTTQIDFIGKWYVTPATIAGDPAGPATYTQTVITVVDVEMTPTTVVSWNFVGALPTGGGSNLEYGNNFRAFVETRAGQVLFHFYNSSNRTLVNAQIQYVAYYNQ